MLISIVYHDLLDFFAINARLILFTFERVCLLLLINAAIVLAHQSDRKIRSDETLWCNVYIYIDIGQSDCSDLLVHAWR